MTPKANIDKKNQFFQKKIETFDKTGVENFESFLNDFEHVLPKYNQFVVSVKLALFKIYGKLPTYNLSGTFFIKENCNQLMKFNLVVDLNCIRLERKKELGYYLLELSSILEPMQSQFRHDVLFDLQDVVIELLKRSDFNRQSAKVFDFISELIELLNYNYVGSGMSIDRNQR